MYRRVVLDNRTWINGPIEVLYRVRGALLLTQQRRSSSVYDPTFSTTSPSTPSVFEDSVRLRSTGAGFNHTYEFVFDVSENQPVRESVEEITDTGVSVAVFNENGVLVCRNVPKTPASGPEQTVGPGEMTSVPGEEPGEMTSEPIDSTGEMTSEPVDGPGEMSTEPVERPGEMTSVPGEEPGEMI